VDLDWIVTTFKDSVISDDTISSWEDQGPPICFNNQLIRKMLKLASAGKDDVFYDLGSGWGQNMIIALSEFKVKKAVGIEDDRERYDVSTKRLRKWKIPESRWAVVPQRFEKVLGEKVPDASLREATIVFYGLSTDISTLNSIARNLPTDGRLVYYYGCLFPEIMPVRDDFPFFLSRQPFRRPSSELEWLRAVVKKNTSSINGGRNADSSELWSELKHDYDIEHFGNPIIQYRSRLRRSVGANERIFRVAKNRGIKNC